MISSPIHMMTVVPNTMQITIVAMLETPFGISGLALPDAPHPLNSVPERASSM